MPDTRNRLIYERHDAALAAAAREFLRGRVIDIGCGKKPYEELLRPWVTEHVGVDHAESLHGTSRVDLVGTAYAIPSPEAAFDGAICTAVLEHLEEPGDALAECFRVLKPGAYAIYTVPHIWHVHEAPRDFYRFTRYGLEHRFRTAGFEVVKIEALSGFWVTFGTLLLYNVYRADRGPVRRLRLLEPLGRTLSLAFDRLDRLDRTEIWTWMYLVVARRPV